MHKDIRGTGYISRTMLTELNNQSVGAEFLLGILFDVGDINPETVRQNNAILPMVAAQADAMQAMSQLVFDRTDGGWATTMNGADEQLLMNILCIIRHLGELSRQMGARFNELEGHADANDTPPDADKVIEASTNIIEACSRIQQERLFNAVSH
jgi:hypothetical protein